MVILWESVGCTPVKLLICIILSVMNMSMSLEPIYKPVSMGTKMGPPSYANLFIGFAEQNFFQQLTGHVPALLLRYIDAIFGVDNCTVEELQLLFILFLPSPHFTQQGLFNWILNWTQVSAISNGMINGGDAVCHHLLLCKCFLKRFHANYWFHFQGIL